MIGVVTPSCCHTYVGAPAFMQTGLRINKHVSRKVTLLMPLRVQLILALSSDVKEGRKVVYLKQPSPSPTSFSGLNIITLLRECIGNVHLLQVIVEEE